MVDAEPPSKLCLSDADTKALASEAAPSVGDPQIAPIKNSSPDDRVEYITGYKLAVVIASVILCCFLMLLDNLIVSTVSHLHASCRL